MCFKVVTQIYTGTVFSLQTIFDFTEIEQAPSEEEYMKDPSESEGIDKTLCSSCEPL